MAFLGIFGKRRKTNLNDYEHYKTPEQASDLTLPMKELAKRRIQAGMTGEETPGVGFGPGFLDKATSAPIAKLDASFRERTLPRINNAASARGLGRSNLVVNEISRAEQENNRDVADLMSKFFTLNKAQEKADVAQGIGLGENLQARDIAQANESSRASERVRDATLGVNEARNNQDITRQNQVVQGAAQLAGDFFGSTTGQNILNSVGIQGFKPGSTQANLLGGNQYDINALETYLKAKGLI